jgi:predicted ester cyclase
MNMSTVEENKAIARLYSLGDPSRGLTNVEVWDDFVTRHHTRITPGLPEVHGLENFKKMGGLRSKFSDIQTTIDEMIAEGNKVVVRWSVSAESIAPVQFGLIKIPAGKTLKRTGITILRFRGAR